MPHDRGCLPADFFCREDFLLPPISASIGQTLYGGPMRISAVLLLLEITRLAAGASSDDYYKAIRANDIAQLKSLIAPGDVNVKDRRGATPLMYAASVGSVGAVKLLLAAGADVKITNSF